MAALAEEEEDAAAGEEKEDGDEEGEDSDGGAALQRLEELLAGLHRFRDGLKGRGESDQAASSPSPDSPAPPEPGSAPSEPQGPSEPQDPAAALAEEMEKTLKLMEEVPVPRQVRGRALLLRAQALAVSPGGGARAEQALSRAVKLEPGLVPAWTRLGEELWRRGDITGARACFAGALAHGEDAGARRLLSMALRAGPGGGAEALRDSLRQAEAAVRCDPADWRSWYVLGNAYVSLFFAGGQSPEAARRALGAYAQAERVDPAAGNSPDLHLNRATLLQYQELYGPALEGLSRAASLAPAWDEPRRRHAHLTDFLSRLCGLLATRGKLRGKRRRGLAAPPDPAHLGPLAGAARPLPLAALRPGANPRRVLLARVIFSLVPEEGVPYAVGVSDAEGAVAVVTVYNAAPGWGVAVGDGLALPEPRLRLHQHQHQGKTFSFSGLRVTSPLALLVNGRRPPGSALAPARLALTNQSGAEDDEAPPPPPPLSQ